MKKGPFPDPWASSPGGAVRRSEDLLRGANGGGGSGAQIQFQFVGVDGERQLASLEDYSLGQICCLNCCPCLVGQDRCSPERRSSYRRCVPTFVFVMSVLQLVMLVVALAIGGGFVSPGCNPMLGPGPCAFVTLGAANLFLIGRWAEVHRLFLPTLLHAGIVHIAMNLFVQLRFGLYLERRWGSLRTMAIYWTSAVGGALLSVISQPGLSVGASAALMGLLGAHVVEIGLKWHSINQLERKCTLVQLLVWIAVILLISISPIVDAGGHVGGLVCGALLAVILFAGQSEWAARRLMFWAAVLALTATVLAFISLVFVPGALTANCTVLCAACPRFCQQSNASVLRNCTSDGYINPCSGRAA